MKKKNIIRFTVILFATISPLKLTLQTIAESNLVTELQLSIHISEIVIKNDRDVDNNGEFHFWRKILGKSVRLPQNGEITRKANESIRPADPNLDSEPFWYFKWSERGETERYIEFDGYEHDTWPDKDDYLGITSTRLDLTTFEFIALNTNRKLEAGDYDIAFTIRCAPQISSSTHRDSTQTYSKSTLKLEWTRTFPAGGILGYSYLLDNNPDTKSDDVLEGTHTSRTYYLTEDTTNHTYWFHVRAGDKAGYWSNTGHFKINTGHYKLEQSTNIASSMNSPPYPIQLHQNYPNPFNTSTVIAYEIPEPGMITVRIYNLAGQLIRTLIDEYQAAGQHQVSWNGRDAAGKDVASGMYVAAMQCREIIRTHKLTLIR